MFVRGSPCLYRQWEDVTNEKNQFIFHEAAMEEMRSLTKNDRDLSNSYQVFEPKPILLSDEAKKYVPDFMKDASNLGDALDSLMTETENMEL